MIRSEKLNLLRSGVNKIVREVINPESLSESLQIEKKSDRSIVTRVDKEISKLIEIELEHLVKNEGFHFFSEENMVSFGFPSIILDPIDGTRELAKGLGECVVSLAVMTSSNEGFSWIYNPFTGFEISSKDAFCEPVSFNEDRLFGLVSRTDYSKGIFSDLSLDSSIVVEPRGSIAFKLALLASGACDFVYSKTPKSVWDIAAGTLLCWDRKIKLFQSGAEVKRLDSVKIDGELIWCREKDLARLQSSLLK
ncbi:inositol monophosphatase family protein [Halobacteriovorax sp. HLS]|uniref:inositol monophosphatase family protein n=1 Tax=Halobacteriovorax sp. HLS TaxID=2234000 RepID=UPI000FDC4453|nr:inositol monophosphatase family protein [Halobacteriovorax sp. HLS]